MRFRFSFGVVRCAVLLLAFVSLVIFHVWPSRTGVLRVRIASDTCVRRGSGVFLLNVTGKDELLIGSELVERGSLASRLSEIYATRSERVLYHSADGNVPFHNIADVIDAVQQVTDACLRLVPLPEALRNSAADHLNIEVRLLTPGAVNMPCHENCYNWGKEGVHWPFE
jgi:biopolymer transport protein ExbD